MKLDYKKMVEEIDFIVSTDFVGSMEMKLHSHEKYHANSFTQQEAAEMSKILSRIYLVAHCITCKACQTKYHSKAKI